MHTDYTIPALVSLIVGCIVDWHLIRHYHPRGLTLVSAAIALLPALLIGVTLATLITDPLPLGIPTFAFFVYCSAVVLSCLVVAACSIVLTIFVRCKKEAAVLPEKDRLQISATTALLLLLPFLLTALTCHMIAVHTLVTVSLSKTNGEIETLATTLVRKGYASEEKVTYREGSDFSSGGEVPLYRTVTIPERIRDLAKWSVVNRPEGDCEDNLLYDEVYYLSAGGCFLCVLLSFFRRPRWLALLTLPAGIYSLWRILAPY
jgi:hypothetical protein